ncbi:metallophosphoesterase [Thermotoga sp. KOL6]|uniref:metallophosphoesterase family protein n=1 Tax=Thermotoga sp. KOL6 TaxID=126741 RepID=UPI000C7665C4|nr:metallophosphoesterase [Thermotoga sp. KOL6]PLV60086.1 hypothetical protein AS005_02005 [Thermotoga sp. KOL6]
MKFLFVSDLHFTHVFLRGLERIAKEFDVLINCGDICGITSPFKKTHPEDLKEYLEFMDSLGIDHYFIFGNDDYVFEYHPRHLSEPREIDGIWLVPFEYVPTTPFNTNREKTEEELKRMLEEMEPPTPFIFVSHAPPFGILDVGGRSMKHLGSVAIREFVFEKRPLLHAFGHIHESPGHEIWNGIHFINCSWGNAFLVEIEEGNIIEVKRYQLDLLV